MTNSERTQMKELVEEFDALNDRLLAIDALIDRIDGNIEYRKEMEGVFKNIDIQIIIDRTSSRLVLNESQVEKLKEFLDSCRCDVRKRLEEL